MGDHGGEGQVIPGGLAWVQKADGYPRGLVLGEGEGGQVPQGVWGGEWEGEQVQRAPALE